MLLIPGIRPDVIWIPAFAGMTLVVDFRLLRERHLWRTVLKLSAASCGELQSFVE